MKTSKPINHIRPTNVSFPLFHCSTKNNSTMINFSSLFIQLHFLHSSDRPCLICLLPLCQNKSKWKTIHRTSAYRLINSFFCEMFHIKTRFESEAKGNIHPWAAHRSLWFRTVWSYVKGTGSPAAVGNVLTSNLDWCLSSYWWC